MSERNWRLFIEDILESITKIETYIAGMTSEKFQADSKTIDAVIRNLEIIGEACKNIPQEVRSEHPEIEWQNIMGLRNRVIHAYFGVDPGIVWQIITKDIPALRDRINNIT